MSASDFTGGSLSPFFLCSPDAYDCIGVMAVPITSNSVTDAISKTFSFVLFIDDDQVHFLV